MEHDMESETRSFIAGLSIELASLASEGGLDFLAYLLAMAAEEAHGVTTSLS